MRRPLSAAAMLALAACATDQDRPALAWNPVASEYMVAFLDEGPAATAGQELRAYRHDKTGAEIGAFLQPFGAGTHQALTRPAIAWNAKRKQYLIATTDRTGAGVERVLVRPLSADGKSLCCVSSLFDDGAGPIHDGDPATGGHGALQITYNVLLDQFLVTVQRSMTGASGAFNGVWGQLTDGDGAPLGKPVALYETQGAIDGHGVAHAPLAGTTPAGGRYALVDGLHLALFDATLKPFAVTAPRQPFQPGKNTSNIVFLNHGEKEGKYAHSDVAYGEVAGKKRFLVVFADENNLDPTSPTGAFWKGVWGAYVDAARTDFPHGDDEGEGVNTPFPISTIALTNGTRTSYRPRVAYDPLDKRFVVAWREPSAKANTPPETSGTHIRAAYVDYDVPDHLTYFAAPHPNVHPISTVTLPCRPSTLPTICLSKEDPDLVDVAPGPKGAAVFVWRQTNPNDPADTNVESAVRKLP